MLLGWLRGELLLRMAGSSRSWMMHWPTRLDGVAIGWCAIRVARSVVWAYLPLISWMLSVWNAGWLDLRKQTPNGRGVFASGDGIRFGGWRRSFPATLKLVRWMRRCLTKVRGRLGLLLNLAMMKCVPCSIRQRDCVSFTIPGR